MTIIKTPDDFFRDATLFNPNSNTYLISYPHFIDYFNKVSTITFHEMTIGINFTYGWMPTIFDYRSDNYNKAVEILNGVKMGIVPSNEDPNNDELIILRNLFNNSIVGASKLMHFINPDIIPICDSRVCEYLTGSKAYYQIDNIPNFIEYIDFCNTLILDQRFIKTKANIETKVGYTMSNMRIADLVMYSN